ncbi:MAG: 8-amino-7-oxononanoate synthase [Cyanophyceae cyanobacterium]
MMSRPMPDRLPPERQSSERPTPYGWIDHALATIHRADWHRQVRPLTGLPGPVVMAQGRSLRNFASNDYLGLAGHPATIAAAQAATARWGTGSTGSRLVTGERPLHRQLERAIARLKGTDDAIVFSSGYLANLGAIAALVGPRDLILSDHYNHASLLGGIRLSGATALTYDHNAMDQLAELLATHRDRHRRCLIVTDTVFSMDGDVCPLPALLDLADAWGSMVLVDEAHGTGVLGDRGAGAVEQLGCTGRSLLQMGTLSKALGSLGGYVAGSAAVIDFLRNRASTWIYTTGLSPADTAAALAAIAIVRREPQRRQRLWRNVETVAAGLGAIAAQFSPQVRLLPSDSPILCLQVPTAAIVVKLGQILGEAGFLVGAIRPPTVPTSRLRITVRADHDLDQCEQLIAAIAIALAETLTAP